MTLTPEQTELAAKALEAARFYPFYPTIERLIEELAKVGLAIQPINEKETK